MQHGVEQAAGRSSLPAAITLLLLGAALLPLTIAGIVTLGPAALVCGFPAVLLLAIGTRELNRWTRGTSGAPRSEGRSTTLTLLLVAYLLLSVAPVALAAADGGDWSSPISLIAAAFSLLLVALLARGSRAAWIVLLVLDALVLTSFIWAPGALVFLVLTVARLVVLLSPALRAHVGE
jgi:hypothetical protein